MRPTRRGIILGGIGALAAVPLGFAMRSQSSYVEAVIRDHFGERALLEDDVRRFAADFASAHPGWTVLKHQVLGRLGEWGLPLASRSYDMAKIREEAITAFVLGSTALWEREQDEPIEYLEFPDPYRTGCIAAFVA